MSIRIEAPAKFLRRGLNVLALENHRPPINPQVLRGVKRAGVSSEIGVSKYWAHAGLIETKLSASGSGVTSNTKRPPGLQIWNASVM